jgi:hypothetical protein
MLWNSTQIIVLNENQIMCRDSNPGGRTKNRMLTAKILHQTANLTK